MNMFIKPHWIFVIVVALGVGGCGEEQVPEKSVVRPIRAIKVADATQLGQRSFPGQAKATREINLSFRVAGPLIVLPNDIVGKSYKRGQLIARIDPRDYEVRLQNAQGHRERAKAALTRAQADYDRVLNIQREEPGATSQAEVDRKRQERDTAKANIKSHEASVAAAKDQLRYTYLKASFDGTVVANYVENFQAVRAKQPIVRLLDDSRIEMIINIPEQFISYAPQVKRVFVRFDSFPDLEIAATIKEIGSEASQTTRTFPVTLIMDQPKGKKILPGMAGRTLRAEIEGETPQRLAASGIDVPVSAVFSPDESGKSYVWVIDVKTKTVKRREVEAGKLTDRGLQVLKGLKPGEWIATAGAHYLREGQQVELLRD